MIAGRARLRGLDSLVRERAELALRIADFYSVPVTVTSGYRGWAEQTRLRRRYEEGKSRWPANRPGDSAHNYGLAFDSATEPRYQPAWNFIRQYVGFEVLPNDEPHGQVPNWRGFVPALPGRS